MPNKRTNGTRLGVDGTGETGNPINILNMFIKQSITLSISCSGSRSLGNRDNRARFLFSVVMYPIRFAADRCKFKNNVGQRREMIIVYS